MLNTRPKRPLGIPTVDTRVTQEIIRQLLDPLFEPQFHEHSFGFRKGRGCHQAVERVLKYTRDGYRWTVDVDIKGFFDHIDHDLIMSFLRAETADGNILDIIETFLASGVKQEAEEALDFAKRVLNDLKLECSEEKTRIASLQEGFTFLGFDINSYRVTIRGKSREKFEDAIRAATRRSYNLDAQVFQKLNRIIRGTRGLADIRSLCLRAKERWKSSLRVNKWGPPVDRKFSRSCSERC